MGECVLISSLLGMALRTLVESRGLPSDSTCVVQAEPGKFDIKLRELAVVFYFISLLETNDYDVIIDICVDSASY